MTSIQDLVIARSEATKQSRLIKLLDCFASLAMTVEAFQHKILSLEQSRKSLAGGYRRRALRWLQVGLLAPVPVHVEAQTRQDLWMLVLEEGDEFLAHLASQVPRVAGVSCADENPQLDRRRLGIGDLQVGDPSVP